MAIEKCGEESRTERQEDISYYISKNMIWPPTIHVLSHEHPFMKALYEVLERLPEDVFAEVVANVYFVVEFEGLNLLATNAPIILTCPPTPHSYNLKVSNIIIFNRALELSHPSLVGLIAHEIAHSIHPGPEYHEDEKLADDTAREWGFAAELEALADEKSNF
jgi:hypothetical protein